MPGQFKMTPEVMDQVIFGMENQKEDLVLDSETGLVMTRASLGEEDSAVEDRFFDLPEWTPSDGFRLMEGFAGSLKNPIYRERLRHILNTGRGVFRGFKNVLKERPDLEKKWFLYKERLMKQRVREWYADLCGYWDARDTGEEPAETEDLFLGDFSIRSTGGDDPEILRYRQESYQEIYRSYPDNLRDILIRQSSWRDRPADFALKALTPEGAVSGILTGFTDGQGGESFLFLDSLYILPEFRGAGIASGLVDRAAALSFEQGITGLFCTLPPEGEVLSDNLKRKGFKPFRRTLELDVRRWYYETAHPSK